jgi:hypothetical protein
MTTITTKRTKLHFENDTKHTKKNRGGFVRVFSCRFAVVVFRVFRGDLTRKPVTA